MEFIIDGYGKKRKAKKVKCIYCGIDFLKAERFLNKSRNHFCCNLHSILYRKKPEIKVICSTCNKIFYKTECSLKNSKSGLYFCSRKCKDKGQTIKFGLKTMWPDHYDNNGYSTYRRIAFDHYEHKCECCNFDQYKEILQVHHIDCNRENNIVENLIILCPNCHSLLTFGFAKLMDRKLILI